MTLKSKPEFLRVAVLCIAAAGLSACGFDGVELNGKIFDAVGLNTGSVKTAEPKLKERQALVVPPDVDAQPLPEPGSGRTPVADLGIADHDAANNPSKEEMERRQAEFCAKNYDEAKAAVGDAEPVQGTLGDCRKSVLTAIGNLNKSDDGDDAQ